MTTIEEWLLAELTDKSVKDELNTSIYAYHQYYNLQERSYLTYLQSHLSCNTFADLSAKYNALNYLNQSIPKFTKWVEGAKDVLALNETLYYPINNTSGITKPADFKLLTVDEIRVHVDNFTTVVNTLRNGLIVARKESIRIVVINLKDNGFDLTTILKFIQPMIFTIPTGDRYGELSNRRVETIKEILNGLFSSADIEKCSADLDSANAAPPQSVAPRTVGIYNVGTLNNSDGGIINCNSPDTSVNQQVTNDDDHLA